MSIDIQKFAHELKWKNRVEVYKKVKLLSPIMNE